MSWHFEDWEVTNTPESMEDPAFSQFKRKKEKDFKVQLVLNKQIQKVLKYIATRKNCTSKFLPSEELTHFHNLVRNKYFIDIIIPLPYNDSKEIDKKDLFKFRQFNNTSNPRITNDITKTSILKEKLKIDKKVINILKECSQDNFKKITNISFPSIEINHLKTDPYSRYLMEIQKPIESKKRIPIILFKEMTSTLENEYNQILEKDLKVEVNKNDIESEIFSNSDLKFLSCNTSSIENFKIPLIYSNHNHINSGSIKSHFDNYSLKEWELNSSESINMISLDILFDKTFDPKFSKLNIFKKKVKKFETSNYIKCNKKKLLTKKSLFKIWKIPKDILKNLEWKPFDKINHLKLLSKLEQLNSIGNNINFDNFFINLDINFQFIEYSKLEIIDLETQNFRMLRTGLSKIHHTNKNESENIKTKKDEPIEYSSQSTESINYSTIPQKRVFQDTSELLEDKNTFDIGNKNRYSSIFLDDQFTSLIIEQKQKLENAQKKAASPTDSRNKVNNTKKQQHSLLLSVLDDNIKRNSLPKTIKNKKNGDDTSLENNKTSITINDISTTLLDYLKPLEIEKNVILTNSNNLQINQSTIYYLRNKFDHQIEEVKFLDNINCDFILEPFTCLKIIDIEKFFQVDDSTNNLFYLKDILQLLQNFKKIFILIKYSDVTEQFDNELFWKVRVYLNYSNIETIFINNNEKQTICYCIHNIIKFAAADELNGDILFNVNILDELGFNQLLSQFICEKYDLTDFFVQYRESNLLTNMQLEIIENLLCYDWG